MRKLNLILLMAGVFVLFSCEKIFMEPNPSTSNEAIFEEYVKVVKEKYAMLEFKGVDIDALADSLRPFVQTTSTEKELWDLMTVITYRLKDGHSNLYGQVDGNDLFAYYDFLAGYSSAYDSTIIYDNYIGTQVASNINAIDGGNNVLIEYGTLPQDAQIGYIRIPSFDISLTDNDLETIFKSIKGTKGLIIDIRLNGGGDPVLATKIAAYLTENNISIGFERFKIGPGANDFSDSPGTLKPANSENRYKNPVAILVDRNVYSAALTLCYSTSPLGNVTYIGQRTGGGSGSVATGYLANGWAWDMSVSEFIGIDNNGNDQRLDDGFEPDISVALNKSITTNDEILDRAISELQ